MPPWLVRSRVLGHAPYGYRYVPKGAGGGQAGYEIVLEEARVVRQIFDWVGRERLSMGEVSHRLMQAGVLTRTGKTRFRSQHCVDDAEATLRTLGKAAKGSTSLGPLRPRLRAEPGHPLESRRPQSPYPMAPSQWIEIPVPPLVSEELFAAVQEQLIENQRRAKQSQRECQFLVQGLAHLAPA
jgi:site-specific DNA recombinase